MFAGAAREAVFSRPEVIRRVRADFVSVALKAALVNNPPDGEEGRLFREIGRSKPAPQGICVINSAGKVLDWTLMFDDDKSVDAFLDHCLQRFAHCPDAKQPVPAERYMRFPSAKLDDVADTRQPLPVLDQHPKGEHCPGTPPVAPGTLALRLYGRALGRDGKPMADTVRQEHYVEDRFDISVEMQEKLAKAVTEAGNKRFRMFDELARMLVSHAYLGQLDVNPVSPPGGRGNLEQCEFWAERVQVGEASEFRLRVEGVSTAAGATNDVDGSDGRQWQHEVQLAWDGLIQLDGNRVSQLFLVARGNEKLKWGNQRIGARSEADVTHLPGGHPIDLDCGVRYGLIDEPAAADRVAADAPPALSGRPVGEVPEDSRRQLVEVLGPPFLIFRQKVQTELLVSAGQKERLQSRLAATIQDATAFFQRIDGEKPFEHENSLQSYRQKAQDQLTAFLEELLNADQLNRFRQLQLQHDGAFALGNPAIVHELKIDAEQQKQFMAHVQEMQGKIQALVKEARSGSRREEIRSKAINVRKEYEPKIAAILTEAQKQRWKELLGKPLDLTD